MDTAVSINSVNKRFGSKQALSNLDLSVPVGQIFGFLGPNGAGKTTTIRCMMDYIRPTTGAISILGKDAQAHSAQLKHSIGYLSSDMQLHGNWTAQTHIDFMSSLKGRGQADKLIQLFNLDTTKKVSNLSSGNKQKLAIVLAFLGQPKLLIMDEPTRGLDPLLQNHLYELLRDFSKQGGTVFLSSHNLSEVQTLCHSVAVVRQGSIVATDTMEDILQLRVHIIRAVATKPFKKSDFTDAASDFLHSSGKHITLKVQGPINPVLKKLSSYDLIDLEVSHPSLEDVFMEYYHNA